MKCYYSRTSYLDATEKRELAQLARDTGLMSLNEIRELFGLLPLPDGLGDRRLQSLNYVNSLQADAFQSGKYLESGFDEKN